MEIFTAAGFTALLQVIAIDLVLAGDNAIVIGLAAAGLPAEQRKKAILVGIIAATVLRIGFALITQQLLADRADPADRRRPPASLGVLEDVARTAHAARATSTTATEALSNSDLDTRRNGCRTKAPRKTFAQAAWQIVIADVSMSLDNVLAVAGAAMDHSDRADHRPGAVDRADGPCRHLHRTAAAQAPLDRLCRPARSSSTSRSK